MSRVGKCLVNSCAWQGNEECRAPAISVGMYHDSDHDCVTWLPRENEQMEMRMHENDPDNPK